MIKVNDIVTIKDFSYSAKIKDGKFVTNTSGWFEPGARQRFKVLVTGCSIPTEIFMDIQRYTDVILLGLEDGSIWFTQSRFLKEKAPETPKVIVTVYSLHRDIVIEFA